MRRSQDKRALAPSCRLATRNVDHFGEVPDLALISYRPSRWRPPLRRPSPVGYKPAERSPAGARPVNDLRYSMAVALLAAAAACSSPAPEGTSEGNWTGTITAEGDVTTVVNESGSVWGGRARLVEEASIGVDVGADEYMLGRVDSLWATDEEILVLDTQVPIIRVYDYDGTFLRNIGRGGQGPGEYARPFSIGADAAGRLFVADPGNGRISLYSIDGQYLEGWTVGSLWCCVTPMVVTAEGVPYLEVIDPETYAGPDGPYSMRAYGPAGPHGPLLLAPDLEVPDHRFRLGDRRPLAKFAPTVTWVLATDGTVITGASHEYRFEMRRPDGSVTVVERHYEPLPIDPDERDWWRRYFIAIYRRGQEGWTWDGAEMPATKPAFTGFWPTAGGDIWVIRPGPGRRLPQCDPNADVNDHAAFQAASCWGETELVDVFGSDGRFLGPLDVPEEGNLRFAMPWVRGDTVITSLYDDSGTIMVKRYRLVPPGEPG